MMIGGARRVNLGHLAIRARGISPGCTEHSSYARALSPERVAVGDEHRRSTAVPCYPLSCALHIIAPAKAGPGRKYRRDPLKRTIASVCAAAVLLVGGCSSSDGE